MGAQFACACERRAVLACRGSHVSSPNDAHLSATSDTRHSSNRRIEFPLDRKARLGPTSTVSVVLHGYRRSTSVEHDMLMNVRMTDFLRAKKQQRRRRTKSAHRGTFICIEVTRTPTARPLQSLHMEMKRLHAAHASPHSGAHRVREATDDVA